MHRRVPCAFIALVVAVTLGGCASPAPPSPQDASTATASPARPADGVSAPPAGAAFDYQLGGPYDPPAGATVIARDRKAAPAGKGYDICYVNGFQTQPDESEEFAREHADLLLHVDGAPLVDPGWPDEFIFDTSTAENRRQLAAIVGDWITGCKTAGYEGVEIDNLDSASRSNGAITADDNIALAAEYAAIAHRAGLAIAQKNTPDHSAELRAAGYDFAVTESCMRFSECAEYTDVYPAVLDIEYTDELGVDGFREACSTPGHPSAMILRDPKLVTPSDPAYHFETCPR